MVQGNMIKKTVEATHGFVYVLLYYIARNSYEYTE